ncbi:MAG: hypothetical protein HWD85_10935 [Flavobacteriaceae bacterium]|nr:hypothetical protein [Flavobacteriaceae bacterium]
MKKIISFFLALSFLSCQSQNNKNKNQQFGRDTIKPQTNISVHKEYDKYGNLKSVDSTYSYFYSNIKNDSILEKNIFKKFQKGFKNNFHPIDSLFIKDFFSKSPFKIDGFYTDSFFSKSFINHQEQIEQLLKRMDSIKNKYYKNQKIPEEI